MIKSDRESLRDQRDRLSNTNPIKRCPIRRNHLKGIYIAMITPQSESKSVHSLARFVTPEAISLLLNIKIEQIKDIRLWPNVSSKYI